jgi:excisionase family DNA binding protein
MPSRRLNPQLVKLHRSYTVGELADRLGVHKNTVRQWRREGLEPLDGGRPVLFQGATVRAFLAARNAGRRRPCGPGRFYCFRCRAPQPPAGGMVDFVPLTARSGNLRAICGTCEGFMHRRASTEALGTVMPGIAVQMAQGP